MRKILGVKRAGAIIGKFKRARILVVGDLIMDHFIWGSVTRISPEAPVPVVNVKSESVMLGGSANVANNIRALGGECLVTGVVGYDADGRKLLAILRQKGMRTDGVIVDSERPTTIKTRVIAHSQQVVRFDRETRNGVSQGVAARVLDRIRRAASRTDVIIISDYAKGLICEDFVAEVTALAAKKGIPVAVDPKVEHFDYYRGVTVVTPNNIEASRASGMEITDDSTLDKAGRALRERLCSKAMLITRGEHGMSLFDDSGRTDIPTVAREVYDVSGAGDTVIAVMGLALGCGASLKEAAVLANFAAGVVVGKIGTATATPAELRAVVRAGLG